MTSQKNRYVIFISFLLATFAFVFRVSYLSRGNSDMSTYNLPWYQTLTDQGIAITLGTGFTNYNPPYTYLLAIATLTRNFLSPLFAIKLIPTFFDILGAYLVYKIIRLKYQGGLPILAAAIYFSAPSVMLNSSFWGQADSIYTSMLLASLYLIFMEKPAAAMAAFGLSLATKAQAAFFIPFLGILFLQKRIHWKYTFIVPIVYLLAVLPVVLLGRPLLETLLIYTNQANTLAKLSVNAPNLYYLFPYDVYERILPFGVFTAITLIPLWIFASAKNANLSTSNNLLLYAFLSFALAPFILPKMHDRYFYPADVFSILLAFYNPSFWFVPILYQFISTASISVFLFNITTKVVIAAGLANSVMVAYLLRQQWKLESWTIPKPVTAAILSWIIAILMSFTILGISARAMLTPLFFRIEYNIQGLLNEPQSRSKYDLIVKSSNITKYLTSDREIGFLTQLNFLDGQKMFTDEEYLRLQNAKKEVREAAFYRLASNLVLYILVMFIWAKNWLGIFQQGIKKGTQLTMALGLVLLILALSWVTKDQGLFLLQVFSDHIWRDAIIASSLHTIAIGMLISIWTKSTSFKNTGSL